MQDSSRRAARRFPVLSRAFRAAALAPILLVASMAAADSTGGSSPPPSKDYYLGEENKLEISVNIWGEVGTPGSYRVSDDADLVELISMAGGPTEFAGLGHIKVTRTAGNGKTLFEIDLEKYLQGDSGAPPLTLMPGDTIQVPRNARHAWKSAIQTLSDIAVVVTLYVLVEERHNYW